MRPAEIRSFLQGRLTGSRAQELREEMLAAAVTGFVPVAVAPELPRVESPALRQDAVVEPSGVIEIMLPSGITVRTSGPVDVAVLRGVLAELGGR